MTFNTQFEPDLNSHQIVRKYIFDWFKRNAKMYEEDESEEPIHWMCCSDALCASTSLAYPTNFKFNDNNAVSDIATVLPTYFKLAYVNPPLPLWYMDNMDIRRAKGLQIIEFIKKEGAEGGTDAGPSTSQNVLTEKKTGAYKKKQKGKRAKSPIHPVGYDPN